MLQYLRKRFKGMSAKTFWDIFIYTTVLYRPFIWRHILNRKNTSLLTNNPPSLDKQSQRLVEDLKRDGIATIDADLFLGKGTTQRLIKRADEYVKRNKKLINFMAQREQELRKGDFKKLEELKKIYKVDHAINYEKFKFFNVKIMGEQKLLEAGERMTPMDLSEPFIKDVMLNDKVIDVANSYLGMWGRINYVNIWYNIPVPPESALRTSQKWHRDPGDLKLVKVFLYVTDVDKTMGPLHYVPGSQHGGRFMNDFPRPKPFGKYPSHEAVEKRFKKEIRACTGKKGTLVFVDTLGLHRGGFTTTRPRVVYMGMFVSDATVENFLVKRLPGQPYNKLSEKARFALRELK